jgi:hypothetical protein
LPTPTVIGMIMIIRVGKTANRPGTRLQLNNNITTLDYNFLDFFSLEVDCVFRNWNSHPVSLYSLGAPLFSLTVPGCYTRCYYGAAYIKPVSIEVENSPYHFH